MHTGLVGGFFFSFNHTRIRPNYIDHGGVHFARFSCPQSAQWQLVASSPFALRLGLSQERVVAPKEINKGKNQMKAHPVPLLLTCRCHEGGRGQEQR